MAEAALKEKPNEATEERELRRSLAEMIELVGDMGEGRKLVAEMLGA